MDILDPYDPEVRGSIDTNELSGMAARIDLREQNNFRWRLGIKLAVEWARGDAQGRVVSPAQNTFDASAFFQPTSDPDGLPVKLDQPICDVIHCQWSWTAGNGLTAN